MIASNVQNTAYFLRLSTVQIRENKNNFYQVLAALIEYNKNMVGTSCFSIAQAYDFLGLKLRTTYAAWDGLRSAYLQMIENGYIRSKPPDEIRFDTLIELEILPKFYEGGFYKLPISSYKKIWELSTTYKEKFFHVFLYMNALKKYNPAVSQIAKATNVSRNTVYNICEQIEMNELRG